MWQRKQTIYLILVVFLMVIATCMATYLVLKIASGIVAVLAAIAIFMFKNRSRQMSLCVAGQILLLLWLVYFCIMHFYVNHAATRLPFYLLLPVLAYLMYKMAMAGIRHDENLIRSADRIR